MTTTIWILILVANFVLGSVHTAIMQRNYLYRMHFTFAEVFLPESEGMTFGTAIYSCFALPLSIFDLLEPVAMAACIATCTILAIPFHILSLPYRLIVRK